MKFQRVTIFTSTYNGEMQAILDNIEIGITEMQDIVNRNLQDEFDNIYKKCQHDVPGWSLFPSTNVQMSTWVIRQSTKDGQQEIEPIRKESINKINGRED